MHPSLDLVGLNLLYLLPGRVGGSEVFARRLVDALGRARPDTAFLAYCAADAADSLRAEGWPANVTVRPLGVRAASKPMRIAAELTTLPLHARRDGVDLLHSLGTTAPILTGNVTVSTVLDLIYEHFPATFPASSRLGLRAVVGPSARRATRVIAISEFVKCDVVERLRVPPERVDAIHLGFGMDQVADPTPAAELRARLGLGADRVVLCVSAALAHKNLARLIDAFGRLGDDLADVRLVIVGHGGRDRAELEARARRASIASKPVFTGWISDADLEGLYRLAACCVYPSLHEGFGMPVLEAMAREVPLACSNATALPEVAGDAAALFDPRDAAAIAAALRRLLTDAQFAAELVLRGRARVAHFTWDRCAQEVLTTYARALGGGR